VALAKDAHADVGTRIQAAEALDFPSLLIQKIAEALSHPLSSRKRVHALHDVADLLYSKQDDRYKDAYDRLCGERDAWDERRNGDWDSAYARGYLRVLSELIERNSLWGDRDVDYDDDL